MSDGAGKDKGTGASSSPRRRRGAASPPRSQAVQTIGGGHLVGPAVVAANADEVRAAFIAAARHEAAQAALLDLLTQPNLVERRLSWTMLAELVKAGGKDGAGGGAPTQILIQNHLPIPVTPAA